MPRGLHQVIVLGLPKVRLDHLRDQRLETDPGLQPSRALGPPVAPRIQVAQMELVLEAELDARPRG